MNKIADDLLLLSKDCRIYTNEPMSKHTSFKIGGCADILCIPPNCNSLICILKYAKDNNIPVTIIGNGSNLLVSDKGIRGIVIKLFGGLTGYKVNGEYIECESGVLLSKLGSIAYKSSLSGLEFASGIPGTLGGAVFMNAGAYDGEMKDVVQKTTYLDNELNIKVIEGENHKFSYRHSIFEETGGIIISSVLKLKSIKNDIILTKMNELNGKRKEKQPLDMPSAGSTFKRPEGFFAAKLIEDAGLKGCCIGGAAVSKKHAGFIVNCGGATANDVLTLVEHIISEVYSKYNVKLQTEIKYIGEK